MNLIKSDTQIFVTALNKLDNPRARELVKWFASEDGVKHIIDLEDDREELIKIIHGYEMIEEGDIEAGEICTIISVDELAKLKEELDCFNKGKTQQVMTERIQELKDEIVKLKEENESWRESSKNGYELMQHKDKQLEQYKSIIDEINELSNSGDTGFDIKHKLKVILDKLESDK